jgi:hypothetical protein
MRFVYLILLACCALAISSELRAADPKPNIIFVLTDDNSQ